MEKRKTEWRKQRTAASVFFQTFGALSEVHFLFYIPFPSLESQESNASNGVRIGAEMRKIWPLQDNCIQLKDKFASCEFGTPTCEIKAYLAKWKWNTTEKPNLRKWFCNLRTWSSTCENGFQVAKSTCEIFTSHHATCEIYIRTGIFVHQLF